MAAIFRVPFIECLVFSIWMRWIGVEVTSQSPPQPRMSCIHWKNYKAFCELKFQVTPCGQCAEGKPMHGTWRMAAITVVEPTVSVIDSFLNDEIRILTQCRSWINVGMQSISYPEFSFKNEWHHSTPTHNTLPDHTAQQCQPSLGEHLKPTYRSSTNSASCSLL